MMIIALVLTLAATFSAIGTAAAQSSGETSAVRATVRLRVGETIRVAFVGTHHIGEFYRVRDDTLLFAPAYQSPIAVHVNAIDTLWREATRARRGAKIGGVMGVLLGGFAAIIYSELAGRPHVKVGLGSVVIGGAAGALAGAAIGMPFKHWQRLYP